MYIYICIYQNHLNATCLTIQALSNTGSELPYLFSSLFFLRPLEWIEPLWTTLRCINALPEVKKVVAGGIVRCSNFFARDDDRLILEMICTEYIYIYIVCMLLYIDICNMYMIGTFENSWACCVFPRIRAKRKVFPASSCKGRRAWWIVSAMTTWESAICRHQSVNMRFWTLLTVFDCFWGCGFHKLEKMSLYTYLFQYTICSMSSSFEMLLDSHY